MIVVGLVSQDTGQKLHTFSNTNLPFPAAPFLYWPTFTFFFFFFFLRRITFQFGRDIFQSNSRDHIFTTPILVEIYAIQVILIKIMLTDALRIIVNRVRLMCTLRAHINHLFLETFLWVIEEAIK